MNNILKIKNVLSNGGKIINGKGPHKYKLVDKNNKFVQWVSEKDLNKI